MNYCKLFVKFVEMYACKFHICTNVYFWYCDSVRLQLLYGNVKKPAFKGTSRNVLQVTFPGSCLSKFSLESHLALNKISYLNIFIYLTSLVSVWH
jgi:hypothetical protein